LSGAALLLSTLMVAETYVPRRGRVPADRRRRHRVPAVPALTKSAPAPSLIPVYSCCLEGPLACLGHQNDLSSTLCAPAAMRCRKFSGADAATIKRLRTGRCRASCPGLSAAAALLLRRDGAAEPVAYVA